MTSAADRARLRDLVRRGYDAISTAYRDDSGSANPDSAESTADYRAWMGELAALLPHGARVLDLGCGAGVPAAKLLAGAGLQVLGVDISGAQLQRARRLVPGALFVQADMASLACRPDSFDAVVCLYALIHVPLEDQQPLIGRIHDWLRPGGFLLAIVGSGRWTGVEDYLGAPMFWDHADTATYLKWLEAAGLHPIWDRFVPEGANGHGLILAQRGG